MINLDNFEPYNSIACIDQLIEAAKKEKLHLNSQIQVDIMIRIRKLKVQLYFKECVESHNKVFQDPNKGKVSSIRPSIEAPVTYYEKKKKAKKSKATEKKALKIPLEIPLKLDTPPKLDTPMDVDNYVHSISDNKREVLKQKMAYVKQINPNNRNLKDYFIKKLLGLIRNAEEKELIENAKNAKILRKNEQLPSDGKSHHPYISIVYYPAGGQNKKY